jgi:hypothetical protein
MARDHDHNPDPNTNAARIVAESMMPSEKPPADVEAAATITELPNATWSVTKPIPVVIQIDGDDCIATFFDANISSGGDTPQEAFKNLHELMLSKLKLFESLPENRLGREPSKQLAVLRKHIGKVS